jgi:hypothetical protein
MKAERVKIETWGKTKLKEGQEKLAEQVNLLSSPFSISRK